MKTKTVIRKGKTAATLHGLKALPDEGPGMFSAIVSVFGNVDLHGDRILPGAFAKSLATWAASGDPIPVIFSHQWDDLDAHVGAVVEAKELLPGDEMLKGSGLEANGGLWTKFRLDVADPEEHFARRLAKRLTERRIREFSFAYDVLDERRGSDGANELIELDVLEVGPTLKGANPATRLLAQALEGGITAEDVAAALKSITDQTAAEIDPATKARVEVTFEGAVEEEIAAMYDAAFAYFQELDTGNGGFYWLHQEATYLADNRAIVCVEGWEDPIGAGTFYEVNFGTDEAGAVIVAEAAEIEVTVEVARKGRDRKHALRSALLAKAAGTVSVTPKTGKSKANTLAVEEPEARTGSEDPGGITAADLIELDLLEAEL